MAPVVLGFVGALLGIFLAVKHERPIFGILVFAGLGFLTGYGGGVAFTVYALADLSAALPGGP